jgi:LacI family transcriptional regulator
MNLISFWMKKITENFWERVRSQHPKMKGIFFTNSRAYRIAQIFYQDDVKKYDVVGFDMIGPNIQYLKEDKIDFIINQNPILQGYTGIMNFVNHFVLKKEVKKTQYLPLDIVLKENVDFYIDNFHNGSMVKG